MRIPQYKGSNVHHVRQGRGVQKPRHWQSRRESMCYIGIGGMYVCVWWRPWFGLFPVSLVTLTKWDSETVSEYPNLRSKSMKRISLEVAPGAALPALSGESKMLVKLTYLRAWLVDTAYEDGTARVPGRLWFDSDGMAFRVTLFEASSMVKMTIRATTIDDALTLANQALGSESPPWEVDQYARDKAAEKKSRKK